MVSKISLVVLVLLGCFCFTQALPDLIVNGQDVINSMVIQTRYFTADSCVWNERCIEALGIRTLLRFDLTTPNIGTTPMRFGDPQDRPDLFVYDPCHDHYHFNSYARYTLETKDGETVARGRKAAFCLGDWGGPSDPEVYGPHVPGYNASAVPATGEFLNCNYNQGISVGYQDTYTADLDCQWIDITDVTAGSYKLRVVLNENHTVEELNYDNNLYYFPVSLSCAGYRFQTNEYNNYTTTGLGDTINVPGPNDVQEVTLTPTFGFGCGHYDSVYIHSNGFISWDGVDTSSVTDKGTNMLPNIIAAYYSNWNKGTVSFAVLGIAPLRTLQITWQNMEHADTGATASFQMLVREDSEDWFVFMNKAANDANTPVKTGVCTAYFPTDCSVYDDIALTDSSAVKANRLLNLAAEDPDQTPPVADVGGPYTGTAGNAVQFSGSATTNAAPGVTLQYTWTFGDGSVPVVNQNPTHTFVDPGTYSIILKVSDGFYTSDESKTTATITGSGPGPILDSSSNEDVIHNTASPAAHLAPFWIL